MDQDRRGALAQANGIKGGMVKLGQKLMIPESAGAGTVKTVEPKATTPAKAVVAAAAKQQWRICVLPKL
ncbi:MAG: hypothetical protein EBT07_15615 [Actinobacteria bacterium]|nr:hypothetical protein [Actinomycetota bacterium]